MGQETTSSTTRASSDTKNNRPTFNTRARTRTVGHTGTGSTLGTRVATLITLENEENILQVEDNESIDSND